jgi:glycosyltransferase involved in cell wall biosynthesis
MNDPLLSVCLITYNHSKYIKTAIDSVLMQNINFSWELIIADDFSTDGTREILAKYKEEHPYLIKLILQEKNVGAAQNWIDLITTPSSKYIAYFEGDDYWIDPNKLQKQVSFLEKNPGYSICFHDSLMLWDDKSKPPKYFCPPDQKETSTIHDLINTWFVPSSSIVFRSKYLEPLPDWFRSIHNGDYALLLLLADKGEIKYFNEIMSIYRKGESAMSAGIGKNFILIDNKLIQLLTVFNDFSEFKYDSLIKKKIFKIKREIKYLSIRKKFPIYKYLNMQIWIKKTVNVLNNILHESENRL